MKIGRKKARGDGGLKIHVGWRDGKRRGGYAGRAAVGGLLRRLCECVGVLGRGHKRTTKKKNKNEK